MGRPMAINNTASSNGRRADSPEIRSATASGCPAVGQKGRQRPSDRRAGQGRGDSDRARSYGNDDVGPAGTELTSGPNSPAGQCHSGSSASRRRPAMPPHCRQCSASAPRPASGLSRLIERPRRDLSEPPAGPTEPGRGGGPGLAVTVTGMMAPSGWPSGPGPLPLGHRDRDRGGMP